MIIRRYGIELCRIGASDIELVRQMRNRQDINACMFEQGHISEEQQVEWFRRINTFNNYFFLIKSEGRKVGLIYGKDMDFSRHDCEGGVFIWQDEFLGTDIPAKASICLTEVAFEVFRMRCIYARVRPDNARARQYNKVLGYVPAPEKGENFLVLTRESYDTRIPLLRKAAAGGVETGPLSLEDVDIPDPAGCPSLYEPLPPGIYGALRSRFR